MKTFASLASLLICVLLCPRPASAWDPTGHMLVDQVAYENTKPEARLRVTALVEKLENKYNNHIPYNFVTAGCYMDDMRAEKGYAYTKWHFMDAPYTPDGSGYAEPAPPHVIWAIEQAAITLVKNPDATEAQKAEAVAMLMHFVGDIHQPLHCVDWNDQGGNGYLIAGVTFSDISKKQVPNLHMFWDRAYRCDSKDGRTLELYAGQWVTERPSAPAGGTIRNQAAKIMADYSAAALADEIKVDDPHDWAKESYALACKSGYPPGNHPTNYEVVTLTPDYVHKAHEIASRRVALAGYRLAAMLNEIFAAPAPK